MKNFWKKTKQTFTIATGKIHDKKENDDPEYLERAEQLRAAEKQIAAVGVALSRWDNALHSASVANIELAKTWTQALDPLDEPYHEQATKSLEGVEGMGDAYANLHQAHIPTFLIKPIVDMKARVKELKKIKVQRKNHQILMKSEEKSLKAAQDKNQKDDLKARDAEKAAKDLEKKTEKAAAARTDYEKWHSESMTGVDELENQRKTTMRKVFQAYQFYLMETVELQNAAIIEQNADFPLEDMRSQFPSATSKEVPAQALPADTGSVEMSDDVSD